MPSDLLATTSRAVSPPSSGDGLTWAERRLDLFVAWPAMPLRALRAVGVPTAWALIAGGLVWAIR